jgi:hypothetical protein
VNVRTRGTHAKKDGSRAVAENRGEAFAETDTGEAVLEVDDFYANFCSLQSQSSRYDDVTVVRLFTTQHQ